MLVIPPATEKNTYFNNETIRRLWREAGDALQGSGKSFYRRIFIATIRPGNEFFLTKYRPNQVTPIFLVNTDERIVAHYQELMKWNIQTSSLVGMIQ